MTKVITQNNNVLKTGSNAITINLQQKTVQGGLSQIVVTADPQYQALESVTVTALPVWEGGSY